HKPVKEKGDHPLNHHAHVMLTLRKVEKEGFNSLKTREWNSHKNVTHWRKQWEIQTNRTLEANNIKARISCETLVKQRDIALKRGDKDKAAELDRKPEIYVGVKAQKIERKRNQTGYTKKEFPYNPPAPTHENHHTNPRKKHRSTWNRDYSKYTKSRAMHNASIIRENSKKYEKHYTKIAVQKVRLQQHLLRYSSAKYKNNPHFKKRLGLVKSLLERIIRSSIKSTKVLNKRNSRYRDYKTRFLMPSRNMKRKRSKSLFLGWEMER
ncbi:MAG: MobA/MobL family protein, partial [Rhizobiales bacterium]|nr:MobA/MobL family protein [Hyphomicrobiales bacterium]